MNQILEEIIAGIDRADPFASRVLLNGTRLVGKAPHIGPEAWLHEIYPPLSDLEISELESRLPTRIPDKLREFLNVANGLNVGCDALAVYGQRKTLARRGDAARQPYCIVTANTFDRPLGLRPEQLVIGGFGVDGSLLVLDGITGEVVRLPRKELQSISRWPDFFTMLREEVGRLTVF